DRNKIQSLDDTQLRRRTQNFLRPLAYVTLFSNHALVQRLLPPGSKEAQRFAAWVRYDDPANPTVALPSPSVDEEKGNDPASWGSFVRKIVEEQDASNGG